MRKHNFQYLTSFEYIVFIHSLQLASGMLIMPSPLANIAGTDGWIAIIFGWMITSVIGIAIILVMQKNPNKNFPQILTSYFGKWLGTFFIIIFGSGANNG
ncbi:GerAB/ArcD/ProY family transporter, partial [Bacillus thuringiensis]